MSVKFVQRKQKKFEVCSFDFLNYYSKTHASKNFLQELTVLGNSETWLIKKHDLKLWDLETKTHVMFRFDRQPSKKTKGCGVILFIPTKVAPKLRKVSNC